MKLLVSTHATQGARKNDFCFVPDGEIVIRGTECDSGTVDDRCGCRRCLTGVESLTGTTTMTVKSLAVTPSQLSDLILKSWVKGGWMTPYDIEQYRKYADLEAEFLTRLANAFPVGTIVERRGRSYTNRRPKKITVKE